ncbi:6-phosphogluconolactonase [Cohnella sp. GCM10027633]|uniref:6-phosphogluconolactonase n=1 Tax=unclassified Cohnella TaxID=2636738 RepID=UPI0036275ED2
MQLHIHANADELGRNAAEAAAAYLNDCIREKGKARLVLSTGASQFEFLAHFIEQPVDWSAVEMFHLDEYIGLPISHPASFRKYLIERFITRVPLKRAYLIDGESNPSEIIQQLEAALAEGEIDLGLIGIGENAHIAFNDPPADFDTRSAYKVVDLDNDCKAQQVREGWFPSLADVPAQAISMTVFGIMSCRRIVSVVPRPSKANAILNTMESDVSPLVPATILKRHADWSLYLDRDSSALLPVKS